jgi:hypothetical protein
MDNGQFFESPTFEIIAGSNESHKLSVYSVQRVIHFLFIRLLSDHCVHAYSAGAHK